MYKHETVSLEHADVNVAYANFDYDKTCMLVCPGWGESLDVLGYSMKELLKLNRPIVVLEHPKQFQPAANPTDYYDNQYQKAKDILGVAKHFNLLKVDLITHSEGSMNGLIAGSIKPDLIRSATLLNPSGIIEYKSSFMFATSMIRKIAVDAKRTYRNKIQWNIFKHHFWSGKAHGYNGIKRLILDLNAATRISIVSLVSSLNKYGVFIAVVAGKDDIIFPSDKIKKYLNEEKIDKYVEVDGWHDELHYNPKKYNKIIGDILREVDEVEKKLKEPS